LNIYGRTIKTADSLPFALKTLYHLKRRTLRLDGKRFVSWKTFVQRGKGTTVSAAKKNCHEMAIISHTGGTTGEPKGVMCSDYSILAEIWQLVIDYPHSRQERYLPVIPPFHNYSLVNSMMVPLSCGYVVILLPKYEPEKFAEYVAKYGPNHIMSIPTYWEALLKIKEGFCDLLSRHRGVLWNDLLRPAPI
jgi:long-chain acyl-CoA synthetase